MQLRQKKSTQLPFECKREVFGSNHLIQKRARKFRCKSKRILDLAQPKRFTPKYDSSNEDIPKMRKVEIIRQYSDPLPTRIKLLALPKVRKLLANRDAYKEYYDIDRERIHRIENLASYSMQTMYSRLANVQPPERKSPRKKWSRNEWKRHCEWLKKRSCPKMRKSPPTPIREQVPLKQLLVTMYHLSQPRYPREKYIPPCGFETAVKDSAKEYEPTERIVKLAEPKKTVAVEEIGEDGDHFDPFEVNPNALSYKPTKRILALSIPRSLQKTDDDCDVMPSGVLKRALIASTTPRTVELSKPKPSTGDDDGEEKPNVNPKALKAKATPRILELAKPREILK